MPVNTMVLKVFMLKNSVILYQIEQFSAKKPVDVRDKMKNIAECSKIKPWREISCLRSTAFLCILDWFWTENRVILLLDTDEISWNTLPMRNWHKYARSLSGLYANSLYNLKYITYEELTPNVIAIIFFFIIWNTLPMRNWHLSLQEPLLLPLKYITYEELTHKIDLDKIEIIEIHYLWGIDTFSHLWSASLPSAEIHYLWGIYTRNH